MSRNKIPIKIILREYLESILVAVILALFVRYFILSAYKIPTESMQPTLKSGDFIFSYNLAYGVPIPFSSGEKWSPQIPARGDVIVFRYPQNPKILYVKRVIGLPGDRIVLRKHHLLINEKDSEYQPTDTKAAQDLGKIIKESFYESTHYVIESSESTENFGPVVVPPEHIFVMGDNRDASDDSRYWGSVPLRYLEGKATFVWLSLDWSDAGWPAVRWDRFFSRIQ